MNRRVLVAGIGNVFFGDDGFGVVLAQRLSSEKWPEGVRIVDVGIRGMHLAFDLLEPVELLVLLDAAPRAGAPGTLYVIEPSLDDVQGAADAHSLSIPSVFAQLRALGGAVPRTRVVGCEPFDVTERLGLSPLVEQALEEAARLVRALVDAEVSPAGPSTTEVRA